MRYSATPSLRTFHPDGTSPASGEILVFGSNLAGRHGKGSALLARAKFGAIYGQGEGLQGRSYAIPTKDGRRGTPELRDPQSTLPLEQIRESVERFLAFARLHADLQFFIVRIGCALAAHRDEDIAPMFARAPANCSFPEQWKPWLESVPSASPADQEEAPRATGVAGAAGIRTPNKTLFYAGIGSRKAPPDVLEFMRRVAARLAQRGYVLRSGAAEGSDTAFEQGCVQAGGAAEIWLPWRGFRDHADTGLYPTEQHAQMAETVHPAWDRLSRGPRALHSRNVGQVLGRDLDTPVSFVLCWTPDGCETEKARTRDTGGTGTAIVLAARKGIPVINLANPDAKERLAKLVLAQFGATHASAAEGEAPQLAPPANLWSGARGIGGALTNMSERAREKGCIQNAYPVEVNGVRYEDSEAAYQALKIPGNDGYNDGLMVDIIALKLKQNPRLMAQVGANGGSAWLKICMHYAGAKSERAQSWEGEGLQSRFIRILVHGYEKAVTGVGPKTRVVHVEDAPFDVYIGRSMPPKALDAPSYDNQGLGNPFKPGEVGSVETALRMFSDLLQQDEALMAKARAVKGLTLGCWCKRRSDYDAPCHGDVIAAAADSRTWEPGKARQADLF